MLILKKDERKTSDERKHSDLFVFVLKEPWQSVVQKVEANLINKVGCTFFQREEKKEHAWA